MRLVDMSDPKLVIEQVRKLKVGIPTATQL